MAYKLGYDSSWSALASPGSARDFFHFGRPGSEDALCAELSRLVYGDSQEARDDGLRRGGFDPGRSQFFDLEGMQAMLVPDAGKAFLVFRGTEPTSLDDLTADLSFMRRPTGGGTAHDGFVKGVEALWKGIGPAIAGLREPLVYTGHSLGAALAVVAMTKRVPEAVVTIGCPRVGDAAFVASLPQVPHRRWVDCCDFVTTVPPALLGFRHAGDEHYLDRHGTPWPTTNDAAIAADRMAAKAAYSAEGHEFPREVPSRALADHAPINYVSALLGASG